MPEFPITVARVSDYCTVEAIDDITGTCVIVTRSWVYPKTVIVSFFTIAAYGRLRYYSYSATEILYK